MPTARRTREFTDAFEAMAFSEIDEDVDAAPAIRRAVETLTPHLEAQARDTWWDELKHCLVRRIAAEQGNGAWNENGIDWDERVAEALGVLCGGGDARR
jgi:hypothetical protein